MFPSYSCIPCRKQSNVVKAIDATSARPVIWKIPIFNQVANKKSGTWSYNVNDSVFYINSKPSTQKLKWKLENRLNSCGSGDVAKSRLIQYEFEWFCITISTSITPWLF